MFGKKMDIRKKAIDSMMASEEAPVLMKKPKPEEENEKEGYESMLVTPEEKEMILQSRGEGEEQESGADEMGMEAEPELDLG